MATGGIGEWWALFLAVITLFSHYFIGLLMMPSTLLERLAITIVERDRRLVAYAILPQTSYVAVLITLWCMSVFSYLMTRATPDNWIPLTLLSFSIGSGPWTFMALKDREAGVGDGSIRAVFFLQLAYLMVFASMAFTGIKPTWVHWTIFGGVMCVEVAFNFWVARSEAIESGGNDDSRSSFGLLESSAHRGAARPLPEDPIAAADLYASELVALCRDLSPAWIKSIETPAAIISQKLRYRLRIELVVFVLHLSDRTAFLILGPDGRRTFMHRLCQTVSDILIREHVSDEARTKFPPWFSDMYNRRQLEYGEFKEVYPDSGIDPSETALWHFGRRVAHRLERPFDLQIRAATVEIATDVTLQLALATRLSAE